jgi:hypothetical protein
MKIKKEKQLTLPQLIEWAMDNDVRDKRFFTENSYCIGFDRHGFIYFNNNRTMPLYQTFTVEVEEKITGDTTIQTLVTRSVFGKYWSWNNYSVNELIADDLISEKMKAIYIPNDDYTMTLVWTKEKGLVE